MSHFQIPVKGGPVKGRAIVLARSIDRPAGFEHQADGAGVVVARSVSNFDGDLGLEILREIRAGSEELAEESFVTQFASHGKLEVLRAAFEEEAEDFLVAELVRDEVR